MSTVGLDIFHTITIYVAKNLWYLLQRQTLLWVKLRLQFFLNNLQCWKNGMIPRLTLSKCSFHYICLLYLPFVNSTTFFNKCNTIFSSLALLICEIWYNLFKASTSLWRNTIKVTFTFRLHLGLINNKRGPVGCFLLVKARQHLVYLVWYWKRNWQSEICLFAKSNIGSSQQIFWLTLKNWFEKTADG